MSRQATEEMNRQLRNNEIIEKFVELLTRKPLLVAKIIEISTDAENAFNLLLQPNGLTYEQEEKIVNIVNRILRNEIRILRDNGHGSWVFVQKAVANGEDRIFVYSPHQNFQSNGFKDEDQQIINGWYETPDWKPREFIVFKSCLKATRRQDEFIFALAYALSVATGIDIPNQHDNRMPNRPGIVQLLLNGAVQPQPNVAIWV